MIRRFSLLPLLLLAAGLGLRGCARSEPAVEPGPSAEERTVLESLRAAYALESGLWDARDRIRSREDVVEFFRQGFCEEPARELADYFWLDPDDSAGGGEPQLRVGEPMLTLPGEPRVEDIGPEEARIRLDYPQVDSGPILSPAQTVRVLMRRVDGEWKVCAIESRAPDSP